MIPNAAGHPSVELQGQAMYWNIRINQLQIKAEKLEESKLKLVNQHIAKCAQNIGWEVEREEVYYIPESFCYHLSGLLYMPEQEYWLRTLATAHLDRLKRGENGEHEASYQTDFVTETQQMLAAGAYPKGFDWGHLPKMVFFRPYVVNQRLEYQHFETEMLNPQQEPGI